MNNNFILIMLALFTGALIPIQAATNARFSKTVGNSAITGLMVFIVGFICILLYLILTRVPFPGIKKMESAPVYSYAGGVIVAIYVVMITFLVPRLGVASAIGIIVAGQIFCAALIDHFGLFGSSVRTIDLKRFIGIILMICGLYLVMKRT